MFIGETYILKLKQMNVDYIGVEPVKNAMINTKQKCYSIYRIQKNQSAYPLHTYHGKSNEDMISNFEDWCRNITDNNPNNFAEFAVICYDNKDQEGETTTNDTRKNYVKKSRFTFTLAEIPADKIGELQNQPPAPKQDQQPMSQTDISKMVAEGIAKGVQEALLHKENQELKERIARLEEEIESEEEEEEEENALFGSVKTQADLQSNPMLQAISMMTGKPIPTLPNQQQNNIPAPTNQNQPAMAINGTPRPKEEKLKNMNNALSRLAKVNGDIDLDLLKLAELAEKNKPMFEMAINHIRTMNI